jgi:hypothetical protein
MPATSENISSCTDIRCAVLLLIMTGKEKEKSLSGDRLKNPNNNSAASGDI